ncbi:unnamed protein product [Microthlaspi erraticum]|uniref:PWWP domain-containing protein n=1 Tax=Microthlaspi erraticum TaxID=1685480 RepID=A0A6D2HIY4_9BRAS|nr:unnamed protein product [Microthlaspi erraticum]
MELDYLATDVGSDGDGNGNGDGGRDRVFVSKKKPKELGPGACLSNEDDWDCETKPRFSEMKRENRADSQIARCYDSSQAKDEDIDDQFYKFYTEADEKKTVMVPKEETRAPDYKSLLSEFDEYVASERISSRVSRALSYGFEVGDLVWGKVKSHPWWPGHILNEAFVSPSVRRMRRYGHVLVAFFGDCSYRWFDPAELIPFEPNVAEKSQQVDSSPFAKAVEEAMVEAGRRSALGLTCKCRNPRNFRDTNVQGHFAVDVPGYELQAVYSSKQIKKARDGFSSAQTLSFVKRCALAPRVCDTESIRFFQKKAAVCAFRWAVFEEFDETYEEAFRAKSAYTSSVNRTAPPRGPLSGSLVMAETLGDPKSSRRVKDSTKQDNYLPKKEGDDMAVQFCQVQATCQLQGIIGSSAVDHVLQRRTPYLQIPMKHEQTGLVSIDFTSSSGEETSVSKLSRVDEKGRVREKAALYSEREKFEIMTSLKQVETGFIRRSNEGSLHGSAGDGIKKVNFLKRSSGEIDSENAPSNLKTKKRKKKESRSELNRGFPDKRKTLSCEEDWTKKSSQLGSAERYSNTLTVRNSKLDALQLLSNLRALSLDPFSGSSDRKNYLSIRAVKQFFLRFRSVNYLKSLAISPPSKSAETLRSTNEPSSKSGRKRLSSDHQQDVSSTKKLKKKTIQLMTVPCEKKTNQEEKKRSKLAHLNPVRTERGKKMAPAREIEPTMLVMKFPHGTSLPSTALLKARFGRFGLLDQSAVRVLWKSSICRVVFLYKLDAQTALRYASGNHSLFGNVNVTYSLRDVKASSASEGHEPKKAKTGEPIIGPGLERERQVHQPNSKLKSCLKEPGNGNRGKSRVRFMLGGEETGTPFHGSRKNNGNSKAKPVLDHVEPQQCTVDISEEMMELLVRCNDVVAKVTGLLGYLPYYPL